MEYTLLLCRHTHQTRHSLLTEPCLAQWLNTSMPTHGNWVILVRVLLYIRVLSLSVPHTLRLVAHKTYWVGSRLQGNGSWIETSLQMSTFSPLRFLKEETAVEEPGQVSATLDMETPGPSSASESTVQATLLDNTASIQQTCAFTKSPAEVRALAKKIPTTPMRRNRKKTVVIWIQHHRWRGKSR